MQTCVGLRRGECTDPDADNVARSFKLAAGAVRSADMMANVTQDNSVVIEDLGAEPSEMMKYIWIIGIFLSSLCIIVQLVFFKIRPKIRKIDQKILTQLTAARLINSILEFVVTYKLFNFHTRDVTLVLYQHSDVVLVCWMFVYTQNLYNKIVRLKKNWNFFYQSLLIWILTIPIGVLCQELLESKNYEKFYVFYSYTKFCVLTVNFIVFYRIFYVIISRSKNSKRNITEIIKKCVITFILVCLTSLQLFVTDIINYLDVTAVINVFCVINSFQAIAPTIIFLILSMDYMPDYFFYRVDNNNTECESGTKAIPENIGMEPLRS